MRVNYFKTQWWRLLFALLCLIIACCYLFSPAVDESTLEGLKESLGTAFAALAWFLYCIFWLILSFVSYNEDCIRELNKRVEALENRAITDIEEESPDHYICLRKLGPDKDE